MIIYHLIEEVNKLIKRGLNQAKLPSMLEPIGLSRKGDKKRPDALIYTTYLALSQILGTTLYEGIILV